MASKRNGPGPPPLDSDVTDVEDEGTATALLPARVAPDAGAPAPAGDRYSTRDALGHGGMGEVILVHDHLIGRDVALKKLRRETPQGLRRFAREARVQGQLEHPAIVPVYDLGATPSGTPYFTMKRVRGVSLRKVLGAFGSDDVSAIRFSRRRTLSSFSQICLAVHYAHERGVVHRDIKPENIMLGDYGEVYLLDWGIAKSAGADPNQSDELRLDAADDATREGDLVGTVGYMAPEQARGEQALVDARTDIYALGAILFEILTLTRLHEPGPIPFMIDRILAGVEARPSVRAPHLDVPPELEAACVAATRRDPAERLRSARELHDAIEAFLDGDRDAKLRLENAQKHAEAARSAAAAALDGAAPSHEETPRRARALRDVGKALALDPENQDALRTLVRLLTTPPRSIPPEVRRAQDTTSLKQVRRGATFAAMIYLFMMTSVVWLYWGSVKDWPAFLAPQLVWGCTLLIAVETALRPSYLGLFLILVFSTAANVWSTVLVGPLLIAPSMVAAHAVLYCLMPSWRRRITVIGISALGWTLSVFGDVIGLLPKTVHYVKGGLFLWSPVVDLTHVFTRFDYYAVFLSLIALPAIVVGAMRSEYSKAEAQMRLQAWQLHQLVPDEAAQTMPPMT